MVYRTFAVMETMRFCFERYVKYSQGSSTEG